MIPFKTEVKFIVALLSVGVVVSLYGWGKIKQAEAEKLQSEVVRLEQNLKGAEASLDKAGEVTEKAASVIKQAAGAVNKINEVATTEQKYQDQLISGLMNTDRSTDSKTENAVNEVFQIVVECIEASTGKEGSKCVQF